MVKSPFTARLDFVHVNVWPAMSHTRPAVSVPVGLPVMDQLIPGPVGSGSLSVMFDSGTFPSFATWMVNPMGLPA